jgi:DNA repair exonuclease SbcCD ATPase subunit
VAHVDRDRLRSERDVTADEAERLRATLAQFERGLHELRERNRVELDHLRAEIDQLRAELERNRSELAPAPLPSPDQDEERRAAQARAESLQQELAESERHLRELRSLLGSMGIRFREV